MMLSSLDFDALICGVGCVNFVHRGPWSIVVPGLGWRRWWRYPPSSAYLCKVSQSSAVVAGHVVLRTLLSTALVESSSTTAGPGHVCVL